MMRNAIALAGVAAISAAALADYTGLVAEDATDPGAAKLGLRVCRLWATFDDPDDEVFFIAGNDFKNSILVIETDDPVGFYQHPFNGDTAPDQNLVNGVPEVAYDTFVTIGVTVDDGSDETHLSGLWPGFGANALVLSEHAWGIITESPQGVAGPDGRVLVGQFTVGTNWSVTGEGIIVEWKHADGPVVIVTDQAFECAPLIIGDLNGDGTVSTADLLALLAAWGPCGDCGACPADLDGDCAVGTADLLLLLGNWG